MESLLFVLAAGLDMGHSRPRSLSSIKFKFNVLNFSFFQLFLISDKRFVRKIDRNFRNFHSVFIQFLLDRKKKILRKEKNIVGNGFKNN